MGRLRAEKPLDEVSDKELRKRMERAAKVIDSIPDGKQLDSTHRAEALAQGKAAAADLKSGQAELTRRAAAKAKEKKRTDYLTMQAKLAVEGSIHERVARMEEAERVRAEKQEARRRELGEKRAIEAQKRHAELVKAGRAYEPVGEWDRDASDALAALFSSSWLWESSLARRGGDHLTIEQVIRAWWALSLIAENGGESVTFAQNRPPRGGISASFSENDLRHLHDLGLITFEKTSGQFRLRRGPRLEELRRTFAEELERRRVTA